MSVRRDFNIKVDLNSRMETDARFRKQSTTEWINHAIAHALFCKENMPDQRLHSILTAIETTCVSCHKTIPPFRQVMYSANLGGGLCPECYLQRFGDRGRLTNIMKDSELKEDIRVLTIELKEKTKEYARLNHKEKLDQVLTKHSEHETRIDEILREADQLVKLGDSYFKAQGFAKDEELKSVLDRMKKLMEITEGMTAKANEQIEATEPLVRDVTDFDERYFLERLKKRKPLKELSTEYP